MTKRKSPKESDEKPPVSKRELAKIKKEMLIEEQDRLTKAAEKIALKAMTELQLVQQKELTQIQKQVAEELSKGFSISEIASAYSIKEGEIRHWMSQPSFRREVDHKTIKEGSSDRNERIRGAKRVHDEIREELLKRILEGGLENIPFAALSDLLLKWEDRLSARVEKKEESLENKDFTIMILNHNNTKNGKSYTKIEDFLSDPEYTFPVADSDVIDVSSITMEKSEKQENE